MTEQSAIELCVKHRDPSGFEALFEMYRREAFCHAMGLLGNEADAFDACQEAFSRAFAAMPGMASLDRFYPWFYRILRNHCLNVIGRRRTALAYAESERQFYERGVEQKDPAFHAGANDEQRLLWRALDKLSDEHREILILKYIQASSYERIGALLRLPAGTVMSRLYYARQAFRTAFLALQTNPSQSQQKERI